MRDPVRRGDRSRRPPLLDDAPSWDWFRPPPHSLFAAGWVILPLRLFLGFTFCFAGLQKLANPAFLNASNPASIQSQLAGAARRSPVHALVAPLVHVAVPLGLLIAFAELAIGLGTLLGLWARVAAVGGMALSVGLFLTVSFHSSPYYTGSDIVFVFAWTPLLLAGSGGILSVDAVIATLIRTRLGAEPAAVVPIPFAAVRRACGSYHKGACQARNGAPCAPGPCPYLLQRPTPERRLDVHEIDRRTFATQGAVATGVAIAGLIGGGVVAGVGRLLGGSSPRPGAFLRGGSGGPPTSVPTTTAAPAGSTPTSVASQPRPPGTAIGAADRVPVGGAAFFNDPTSGDPSLVVRPQDGTFLAFDAVCPHAGCTVQYDGTNRVFICPCHGSEFNARTGAVEVGPAATGLTQLRIARGSDGQLYVT